MSSRNLVRTTLGPTEREQAKSMLDVTPYVFVYGTLKKGYGNNTLLRDSTFIGEDSTEEGWVLGDAGIPYAFPPSVVPEEYSTLLKPIKGEVYEVLDMITAKHLDWLEGWDPSPTNAHYWRRVVTTKKGYVAWIYTREQWSSARHCDACNLTDKGEWLWSRN